MFTPLEPRISSASSRAPERLCGSWMTTVVLSEPVRAGIRPSRVTSTKRVIAPAWSSIPSARTVRPKCSAASGEQTAARPQASSSLMLARSRAAAAVEEAAAMCAPGTLVRSHSCTCAWACGWEETVVSCSSAVCSRAASTKVICTVCSATIVMESVAASTSRVPETPPSTEFSIGAMSASMSPAIRSVVAVATEAKGTSSGSAARNSSGISVSAWRSAWWVKVVSGPRNPYRMGEGYSAPRARRGLCQRRAGRSPSPIQ